MMVLIFKSRCCEWQAERRVGRRRTDAGTGAKCASARNCPARARDAICARARNCHAQCASPHLFLLVHAGAFVFCLCTLARLFFACARWRVCFLLVHAGAFVFCLCTLARLFFACARGRIYFSPCALPHLNSFPMHQILLGSCVFGFEEFFGPRLLQA